MILNKVLENIETNKSGNQKMQKMGVAVPTVRGRADRPTPIFYFYISRFFLFANLGEIRPTGRKYRPRSPFCPGRWAENFFEKLCLVPL